MYFGRVVGCVWSTVKDPRFEGQRLLLIQPLTPELQPTGRRIVCTDCVGAGAGELIYWCRGKEASFPFLPKEIPTDTSVVAIIDELHIDRQARTEAAPAPAPAAPPTPAPARSRARKS